LNGKTQETLRQCFTDWKLDAWPLELFLLVNSQGIMDQGLYAAPQKVLLYFVPALGFNCELVIHRSGVVGRHSQRQTGQRFPVLGGDFPALRVALIEMRQ
jgi:hypothetical protein